MTRVLTCSNNVCFRNCHRLLYSIKKSMLECLPLKKRTSLCRLLCAALVVAGILWPGYNLFAEDLSYSDDFKGLIKALSERETAPQFSKWWGRGGSVSAGNGRLTVDGTNSANETIRLQMPALKNHDVIRIVVRLRSSGSEPDSHISFGFVPSLTADPLTTAALWTIDRSDSFAVMYSAGPGNQNQTVGQSWFDGFARDQTKETEHVIEYNFKTGRVTVSIENNGNQRTLVSDSPVNWNGQPGQPIPIDNFAFFAINFYQQQPTEKGADAAYVNSIRLKLSDH